MIETKRVEIYLDWHSFVIGVCVFATKIQIFLGPIDIAIHRGEL